MQYAQKAGRMPWLLDKVCAGEPPKEYVRGLLTPFNIIAAMIVTAGLVLIAMRFTQGLSVVTHSSDEQPWGMFLSVGLFAGVPLSATGFVLGTAVYIFGMEDYHPIAKNAILLGLLGYFFAVVFLMIDLGRPWRIYYPMFISWGPASVMFLVAWHVALYLTVQLLEFAPAIFEWLGLRSLRKWVLKMTVGLTIFGVILSTLHQSALGAMFLLAPGKIHPLWYSPYIPWLFFASAIAAGLSMVIVVSALTLRFFRNRLGFHYVANMDKMTLGMGKAAGFVLLTYFAFKITALATGNHWDLLATSWGAWYLVEVIGFVVVPCVLFAAGSRDGNVNLVRFAAMATIVGVIINRLNISLIAFNWNLPHREIWDTNEAIVVVAVITIEILTYRWIVNRMPVLSDHPDYETHSPS